MSTWTEYTPLAVSDGVYPANEITATDTTGRLTSASPAFPSTAPLQLGAEGARDKCNPQDQRSVENGFKRTSALQASTKTAFHSAVRHAVRPEFRTPRLSIRMVQPTQSPASAWEAKSDGQLQNAKWVGKNPTGRAARGCRQYSPFFEIGPDVAISSVLGL